MRGNKYVLLTLVAASAVLVTGCGSDPAAPSTVIVATPQPAGPFACTPIVINGVLWNCPPVR